MSIRARRAWQAALYIEGDRLSSFLSCFLYLLQYTSSFKTKPQWEDMFLYFVFVVWLNVKAIQLNVFVCVCDRQKWPEARPGLSGLDPAPVILVILLHMVWTTFIMAFSWKSNIACALWLSYLFSLSRCWYVISKHIICSDVIWRYSLLWMTVSKGQAWCIMCDEQDVSRPFDTRKPAITGIIGLPACTAHHLSHHTPGSAQQIVSYLCHTFASCVQMYTPVCVCYSCLLMWYSWR